MPLYEYQCLSCGNLSEVIQRMSDDPLTTCEECGGELKKLLSAPAFQFKGSGWYVTDYANKDGGKGKGGDGKSESGSESGASSEAKSDGGDSSKSETKSAPKAEGKTKAERVASD